MTTDPAIAMPASTRGYGDIAPPFDHRCDAWMLAAIVEGCGLDLPDRLIAIDRDLARLANVPGLGT